MFLLVATACAVMVHTMECKNVQLKVQTLTGDMTMVNVEHDSTTLQIKVNSS